MRPAAESPHQRGARRAEDGIRDRRYHGQLQQIRRNAGDNALHQGLKIKRCLAAGREGIHQAGADPVHGGFADLRQGIAGPAGELFSLARGLFLRFTRGAGGGVQRGDRGVVLFLRDARGTKRGAERHHLFAVALLFRGGSARKLNTLLHKALIFAFGFGQFRPGSARLARGAGGFGGWR